MVNAVAVAALAGWAALGIAGGGFDTGAIGGGLGPFGLMMGLVLGPAIAVAALIGIRDKGWTRGASVAVAAVAGLVGWSAISIEWAGRPDLAWLSANRTGLAAAAVVVGIAWGLAREGGPASLAVGVSVACVPVLSWALGSRVLPDLLAPIDDTFRLTAPIGHANGLAVVAASALPGALVWATGGRRQRDLAVVIGALALLIVALTGSRSGAIAAVVTLGLAVWLLPQRPRVIATLTASAVGIIPAIAYGLTADALTRTPILPEPAERRGAGIVLGVLTLVGVPAAVLLRPSLARFGRAVDGWLPRTRVKRRAAAALSVALLVAISVVAVRGGVAPNGGAGRFLSTDSNNRTAWWGQAWRGFLDAPLRGHGAGSFPVTHLTERAVDEPSLQVRHPHQFVLELAAELGVVGLALVIVLVGCVVAGVRAAPRASAPALCLVAPFLVAAQLDVTWAIPAATLPAVAAVGVIVSQGTRRQPVAWAGQGRVVLAGLVAIVVAVGGVLGWSAREAAKDARSLARAGDAAGALAAAERSTDRNPLAIHGLMTEAGIRRALGDLPKAQAAAERAISRHPGDPTAWECLAAVSTGRRAEEATATLHELDPVRNPNRPFDCVDTR